LDTFIKSRRDEAKTKDGGNKESSIKVLSKISMVGNPKDIVTDNSSAMTAPSNAKNCKSPAKSSISTNSQAQIEVAQKLKKKLQK
jgi:hypothetical protein